ncbi:MAG: asparagine synthase (glutamine-hydrolyzing) [Bacteroidota bacterium]|nr:asparagine synthase (glutamine-hydrolyzing) [Bacteroidota bacterium]
MCGITGFFDLTRSKKNIESLTQSAVDCLCKRGPDVQHIFRSGPVVLGHSRLSIIDPGAQSDQPFVSQDGNIMVSFNGEFYNHPVIRKELIHAHYEFRTKSDAEVVLQLYRKCGLDAIKQINGCFAIAIWDKAKERLILARDRIGIKPLFYYYNDKFLAFASEMKALLQYPVPRELDTASLHAYFQLNYIPDDHTMLKHVYKLKPGKMMVITKQGISENTYYRIPEPSAEKKYINSYDAAIQELQQRLNMSVKRRMLSDVPLGAFLSGGIDSSIIVALASEHTDKLKTYSLGFKDQPYFDETKDAETLAHYYNTDHTSFITTTSEMLEDLDNMLDYLDEPFADSSALAVYTLSKHTSKNVRVALSGDGADEMFGGYNKYMAHQKALINGFQNKLFRNTNFIWRSLPQSRQRKIQNIIRQINRYSTGLNFSPEERYWFWCSLSSEKSINKLLNHIDDTDSYQARKANLLHHVKSAPDDMHSILFSDMHMCLPNDMLYKVDMMSMGNSLEVRTPFLDHHVVDFAFSIPFEYKISENTQKHILRDSFSKHIPNNLLQKSKHGFEVPLLVWFRNELSSKLDQHVFNRQFIVEQGIFNPEKVMQMKKILHSNNPGDIHARIWAMLVFQIWWKKTMM